VQAGSSPNISRARRRRVGHGRVTRPSPWRCGLRTPGGRQVDARWILRHVCDTDLTEAWAPTVEIPRDLHLYRALRGTRTPNLLIRSGFGRRLHRTIVRCLHVSLGVDRSILIRTFTAPGNFLIVSRGVATCWHVTVAGLSLHCHHAVRPGRLTCQARIAVQPEPSDFRSDGIGIGGPASWTTSNETGLGLCDWRRSKAENASVPDCGRTLDRKRTIDGRRKRFMDGPIPLRLGSTRSGLWSLIPWDDTGRRGTSRQGSASRSRTRSSSSTTRPETVSPGSGCAAAGRHAVHDIRDKSSAGLGVVEDDHDWATSAGESRTVTAIGPAQAPDGFEDTLQH
jgi:hypothetical protein